MAQQIGGGAGDKANLSLGLGVATLVAWVAGVWMASGGREDPGWIWIVMLALGAAAVVTALMARRGGRLPAKAMVGLVLGGLAILVYLAFALGIVEE